MDHFLLESYRRKKIILSFKILISISLSTKGEGVKANRLCGLNINIMFHLHHTYAYIHHGQRSQGQKGERIPPFKMLRGREESHKRQGGKASCMA